jgi:ribosome-associated translation inhibitor RaiA
MKFILNHRWLRPDEKISAQLKQKISKLTGLVRIEAAEVTLEKNAASSPPYSAKVHLVIPGPDLYAEEKDHTPEATIHKVLAKLARQIRHRKQKLLTKRRAGAEEVKPWNRSHQPLSMKAA